MKQPIPTLTESQITRFWSQSTPEGDCRMWTGPRDHGGYGKFSAAQRTLSAHRVAFTMRFGPIPDGLVIDHLCRRRACVNADHLEAVTQRENVRRGSLATVVASGACSRGHLVTGENAKPHKTTVVCRECALRVSREWRARRKLDVC